MDAPRRLSEHFSQHEFECHCGKCVVQKVDPLLIEKLEKVRAAYGGPIQVNSGYRCARHQAFLRLQHHMSTSTGTSTHELGQAADIQGEDMALLYTLCEQEFMAIGVAKNFLHVDLRTGKSRRWNY
jgi:zinc D-Ala-D-Ala carboxypeptidase